jgi:hypothetical protein
LIEQRDREEATLIRALEEAAHEEPKAPPYGLDRGMPAVLADALEEAGAPAGLLEHPRGPGHMPAAHGRRGDTAAGVRGRGWGKGKHG